MVGLYLLREAVAILFVFGARTPGLAAGVGIEDPRRSAFCLPVLLSRSLLPHVYRAAIPACDRAGDGDPGNVFHLPIREESQQAMERFHRGDGRRRHEAYEEQPSES